MYKNRFKLTSDRLIVGDPSYDFDTVSIPGLGAIIPGCLPGIWSVEFTMHRPVQGRGEGPERFVAAHSSVAAIPGLGWQPCGDKRVGGDRGMLGVYDAAHFQDDALVPADWDWSYHGKPADPEHLWYSWVCEFVQDADCSVFPYGAVVRWDGGMRVSTSEQQGAVVALCFDFL